MTADGCFFGADPGVSVKGQEPGTSPVYGAPGFSLRLAGYAKSKAIDGAALPQLI